MYAKRGVKKAQSRRCGAVIGCGPPCTEGNRYIYRATLWCGDLAGAVRRLVEGEGAGGAVIGWCGDVRCCDRLRAEVSSVEGIGAAL